MPPYVSGSSTFSSIPSLLRAPGSFPSFSTSSSPHLPSTFFLSFSPCSFPRLRPPIPLPTPHTRKLHQVRATLMQDKDEKLASENAMHSNIFSDKFVKRKGNNTSNETSAFSKRVIQLEQTTNILLTNSVIKILDAFYRDRCYARFYVLETIARVPYFAFMSILHMYESFGWWRKADYLKVHFAESWNELHHLLIMEELGGNAMWYDRFLAQHIAIFYYFLTVLMYAISPRMAYHFSECVERHAFETYDKFIKLHEEDLKKMPAPDIAIKYYTEGDLYLFDEFQTSRPPCTRRPKIDNLYDVFVNIRDDEAEHCKTMKTCQIHGTLKSPHSSMNDFDDNSDCSLSQQADCEGFVDCVRKSLAPQKK